MLRRLHLVTPTTIGFGDIRVGHTASVAVTVTNTSGSPLTAFAGGGIGAPFGGFQNCAGGVPVGGSCAFTYTFTPTTTGAFHGSTGFSFQSGTQSQNVTISVNGNGVGTLADVSPVSIDYGLVKLGNMVSIPVTITNVSAQTLTNWAGGGIGAPFGGFQNCAGGVAPGASCAFTYIFTPTVLGVANGTTSFSFAIANGASQNVTVTLRGQGVATLAEVTPTTIGFGDVPVGHTVSVPVTVTNTSPQPLGSFAGGGVGVPFGGFQNCAGGVAVGSSCQFTYQFTPTTTGPTNATTGFSFAIADGASQAVPITLGGNGISAAQAAEVTPTTIGFGDIRVGHTASVAVTVTNTSGSPLTAFAGGGIGAPFGGFQNCAGGVPVGGSCAFTYTFTPTTTGAFHGSTGFSFQSGTQSQNVTISVNGNGVGTLADVSPVSIDYGLVKLGNMVSIPVTITNVSAQTLTNWAGGGIGAPFGGFQNCAGGVAPGASCAFTYIFTPTVLGVANGTTSFSFAIANGASQNVTVTLRGQGVATLAEVTPTTIGFGDVPVGHTVSVPVTVTNTSPQPLGSFAGGGVGVPFGGFQNCAGGVAVGSSCQFTYQFTPTTTGPTNATTGFSFAIADGASQAVPIYLNGNVLGPPPNLVSAVSRKAHGSAGTFDLPLSLTATNPSTEPRQGPGQVIVLTFDEPISAATVGIAEGSATPGAPTFSGNDVVVSLSGVANQQYVTVSLTNVTAANGSNGGSGSIRVGFLLGDVNQNRVVSLADVGLVNAQLAQPVTTMNFIKDVNASGTLTVADKAIANTNLTRALPAP